MTVTCPKGHQSTEADFCSECGAKINGSRINGAGANGGPGQPAQPSATAAATQTCPDCKTQRSADGSKFCELCGYNFETGAHGEIPMAAPVPAPEAPVARPQTLAPPQTPDASLAVPEPAVDEKWTLVISIDPALKDEGSPDPPADWPPKQVAADRDTLLIGRTSESRAIHPDIALDFDSAVSHRHAILTRGGATGWTIRDIGSSNGTRLNGKDVQPMLDVPLNAGDRVTLGHWTCITLAHEPQA